MHPSNRFQKKISRKSQKVFKGNVRKGLATDADVLVKLGKHCFHEAFNDVTAPDDMAAYLSATFQKSAIEKQLADDHSLIFMAEIDAKPAGYVYLHPASPPECVTDQAAIKLERLYLRRHYYGRGAGDALMQISIGESRTRGYRTIWLSSWELNDRANAFYKKWGFKVVGNQMFTVGSDIQKDFILSREV